jgi:hypothetical protein
VGSSSIQKPIEAIVETLEMASQGHLAVDPHLLQEIPHLMKLRIAG